MPICPNCGMRNPSGEIYCLDCGEDLRGGYEHRPRRYPEEQVYDRRRPLGSRLKVPFSVWFEPLIIIVILIILISTTMVLPWHQIEEEQEAQPSDILGKTEVRTEFGIINLKRESDILGETIEVSTTWDDGGNWDNLEYVFSNTMILSIISIILLIITLLFLIVSVLGKISINRAMVFSIITLIILLIIPLYHAAAYPSALEKDYDFGSGSDIEEADIEVTGLYGQDSDSITTPEKIEKVSASWEPAYSWYLSVIIVIVQLVLVILLLYHKKSFPEPKPKPKSTPKEEPSRRPPPDVYEEHYPRPRRPYREPSREDRYYDYNAPPPRRRSRPKPPRRTRSPRDRRAHDVHRRRDRRRDFEEDEYSGTSEAVDWDTD